jgi:hypothetical protein
LYILNSPIDCNKKKHGEKCDHSGEEEGTSVATIIEFFLEYVLTGHRQGRKAQ